MKSCIKFNCNYLVLNLDVQQIPIFQTTGLCNLNTLPLAEYELGGYNNEKEISSRSGLIWDSLYIWIYINKKGVCTTGGYVSFYILTTQREKMLPWETEHNSYLGMYTTKTSHGIN